ncbi:hypothetical protein, partial [Bradyrhizobium canariense]|uniref:hypothetical protein n=1 Tax=Bradyrhizobium canariense TaxID=255045 RepID=UPI0011781BF7
MQPLPKFTELKKNDVAALPFFMIVNGTSDEVEQESPPPEMVRPWKTPVVAEVTANVVAPTESWLQLVLVSPTPPDIDPPDDDVV